MNYVYLGLAILVGRTLSELAIAYYAQWQVGRQQRAKRDMVKALKAELQARLDAQANDADSAKADIYSMGQ